MGKMVVWTIAHCASVGTRNGKFANRWRASRAIHACLLEASYLLPAKENGCVLLKQTARHRELLGELKHLFANGCYFFILGSGGTKVFQFAA